MKNHNTHSNPTETPRLKIYTLGRFAIEVDGSPLTFGTRGPQKPMGLLKALIALGGDNIAENTLCDVLWPDAEGHQAHWAFATNLHRLRKCIPPESVLFRAGFLSLNPKICWVDAKVFTNLLSEAAQNIDADFKSTACDLLEEALALYQGQFLPGESESSSVLTAQQEYLHDLFLQNVERLGLIYQQSNETDKEKSLYHRGLKIDHQAEFIFQGIMRCCLQQEKFSEGVAHFHRCRRTLQSTMGIDPSSETRAILQSILADQQQRFPLPQKTSLAFLPFKNLSGKLEDEYFGDGIAFDIATDLVKISNLFLINHSASFSYKHTQVSAQQIGTELGVRYVLDGSVRKDGGRLRLTAQLIDTESGQQVWANRFDCVGDDLFAIQDQITEEIVTALEVKLVSGETARIRRKSLKNPQARDCFYKTLECYDRHTIEGMELARQYIEDVIRLEPDSPLGYIYLGWTYWWDVVWNTSKNPSESLAQATKLAQHSLQLESTLGSEYSLLGNIHLLKREHNEAIANCQRAITLRPNCSSSYLYLANAQSYSNNPKEAIVRARHAMRLSPIYPAWYLLVLSRAYLLTGYYEEARQAVKEVTNTDPDSCDAHIILAAANAALNNREEAIVSGEEALRLQPDFSLMEFAASQPYKNYKTLDLVVSLLKKAGLK